VLGLNLLDDIKTTTVAAKLKKITHGLVVATGRGVRRGRGIPHVAAHQDPHRGRGRRQALRRQPAEGRPGQVAVHRPELLILDEPTRGIDVGAKYEIYGIIQRLADAGKGVIVVSSELPELLGLSDRIYTICEGAITGCLAKAEADQESLMRLMTTCPTEAPPGSLTPPGLSDHLMKKLKQIFGGDTRQFGMIFALVALIAVLPDLDRRARAQARERHQHLPGQRLHPGPGDRHGAGDHRRPHRPVRRVGRGRRRHRRRHRR
jgi:hypothetical protein